MFGLKHGNSRISFIDCLYPLVKLSRVKFRSEWVFTLKPCVKLLLVYYKIVLFKKVNCQDAKWKSDFIWFNTWIVIITIFTSNPVCTLNVTGSFEKSRGLSRVCICIHTCTKLNICNYIRAFLSITLYAHVHFTWLYSMTLYDLQCSKK